MGLTSTLRPQPRGRVTAGGMLREGTPVEDRRAEWGFWLKREDLACPPPGPPFSKTRGVYAWVAARPESLIGVLDTYHSQAGHAVARACQVLGKQCLAFYPDYKHEPGPREPQRRAAALGAELAPLPAGRSCILYHKAKAVVAARGGVMIPNALKLAESVTETAREAARFGWVPDRVIVPSSSGTIAAGVVRAFPTATVVIHLGYSRPAAAVRKYVAAAAGVAEAQLDVIDEGYAYKDQARPGPTPNWPCNAYYDLKAFRWWVRDGRAAGSGKTLFWNVG